MSYTCFLVKVSKKFCIFVSMRYVYFVKHKGMSPIKIGRTNDLSKRIAALKNASPFGIEVIGVIETLKDVELEYELHKKFNSFRLNGEWFEVPLNVIESNILLYKDREYIEAKNRFEISYTYNITPYDNNEADFHKIISKEKDLINNLVVEVVLNQKELCELLGTDRETAKMHCESIGVEYKTNSFMGSIKKGYKLFVK